MALNTRCRQAQFYLRCASPAIHDTNTNRLHSDLDASRGGFCCTILTIVICKKASSENVDNLLRAREAALSALWGAADVSPRRVQQEKGLKDETDSGTAEAGPNC
jgi:hypothetical protein